MALVDTGSRFSFLKRNILSNLANKNYLYDSDYITLFGKQCVVPCFEIPEIIIGDFLIEATFMEEDEDFWRDCAISTNPFVSWLVSWKRYLMYQVYQKALIGMDVFQKFACIFDFPHSSIFLADELKHIIENNDFLTAAFHSESLEIGRAGVVLTLA